MRRTKSASARRLDVPAQDVLEAIPTPAPTNVAPFPTSLAAALVRRVEGREVVLELSGAEVRATLDASVDPRVMDTACARGERVIVQREAHGFVVLGALRTAPTPGVDVGDEYEIRAKRVLLVADHEVRMTAGAASVVLRAIGFVETVARDVTTRATSVHKLIGRILHLN